jgi:hypothetical protein
VWSLATLVPAAVAVWAALLVLLLREAPRSAWPGMLVGAAGTVLAGVVAAGLKYPSWEALLILIGAPAIALGVTAGHPTRILDPKWTTPEEEITEEAEASADRYAWRAVLVVIVSVTFLMITFGW